MSEEESSQPGSGPFIVIVFILALIGLGFSVYSVQHHMELKASGATDAFCNINDTFNCDDVARSSWSEISGIPLGIFGVSFFLGVFLLAAMVRFREEQATECLQTIGVMHVLGLLVSLTLAGISYFEVGALCLTCIGIYGTTLVQALVLIPFRSSIPPGINIKNLSNGGTYPLVALAVSVGLWSLLKPDFQPAGPDPDQLRQALENAQQGNSILDANVQQIPLNRSAYSGLGEDYRQGSDEARVTIVEFADFQCGACATAHRTLKQLKSEFGDRILVVFKNFPLDQACNDGINRAFHEFACEAAVAARCAGQIGKFWPMHDRLFDNQRSLSSTNIRKWAGEIGLAEADLQECLNSKDMVNKVRDDIALGQKLGVESTPTLYFNGRKLRGGRSIDVLRAEINKILE